MPSLLLGPILRYVDERSATIWMETSGPAHVEVLDGRTETFTVCGRNYALVVIDGLAPGSETPYQVHLDGEQVWPEPDRDLPPSVIRTPTADGDVTVVVGSCRAAAPHEPPFTLERLLDEEGRGIDTLWAHARRIAQSERSEWPDLLLLIGDQIYADDSSPGARERIAQLRGDDSDLPAEIVANYEEYCWLYHEAWSLPYERWLLSTIPSVMIFDDHDMIDDWNISEAWGREQRDEPWWQEHALGGLMSYWVYQHLGNLAPREIEEEGLLAAVSGEDGTAALRSWAAGLDGHDEHTGTYRFSFARRVGDVTVVMIDCRHGRHLTAGARRMLGAEEWEWVREQALSADGHVVLATTVPVFIADGLHDFQAWSERVCGGVWGSFAARHCERLRRAIDLEHWPAFQTSYREFVDLLEDLADREPPPASIVVASGDIHYSYAASIPELERDGRPVWQVVSSPIRNALIPPERGMMRFTLTRTGRLIGAFLRRAARGVDNRPHMEVASGPLFSNNLCVLRYGEDGVGLSVEHYEPGDDGSPQLAERPQLRLV